MSTIIETIINWIFVGKMDDVYKASPRAFWSILALCVGVIFLVFWRATVED